MIKRHQDASEHMNEEQRVSWVVSPPTPNKQEDSEGCIAGIYPVPSWLRTPCPRSFLLNSVIPTIIPRSLDAALHPVSTMRKTNTQLSSYFLPGLHALAWSWLHGSLVKWKCECSFILPGEASALPECGHAVKREIIEYCSTAASLVAHHQAKCHSSCCSSIHPLWFQMPIKTVNS